MAPRASTHDPYRTFKFRVRFGEQTVAAVTKVSSLTRSVVSNELREGGNALSPRQSPGAVSFDEVTLERGVSSDPVFEQWANAVTKLHVDPAAARGFKRPVIIDVYDLAGNPASRESRPVLSYKLHNCWVSRYVALPELDAGNGGVGIQSVTLRHEGWERL